MLIDITNKTKNRKILKLTSEKELKHIIWGKVLVTLSANISLLNVTLTSGCNDKQGIVKSILHRYHNVSNLLVKNKLPLP